MRSLTLFLFLICSLITFPQSDQYIIDISPDGKIVNKYKSEELQQGKVILSTGEVPFGTTPDWTSTLERQIGGMAWGDYDGDGDLDLATGCYFSNSFPPINDYENIIYRNDNGTLTTTAAWISADEKSTTDIKWVDINNDGKPELLSANGDGSFVPTVMYFNGASGLATSPGWSISPIAWTVGAGFADIDGDGDQDLALANQGNTVDPMKPITIYYNNNGVLSTTHDWASSDMMISNNVAFNDINKSSLVKVSGMQFIVQSRSAFHLPYYPVYSIDTVKVNGNIVSNYCYDPASGWISIGGAPSSGSVVSVSYTYMNKCDMAVSKWYNYQTGIYFNNNGVLTLFPEWQSGYTGGQKGIAWADFDKDGFLDMAVGGSSSPHQIFRNDNGTILPTAWWNSASTNTSCQELITGDLNRDGFPELATVNFGTKRIEIYLNKNGIVDQNPTWLYIAGSSATSISFGDVNGDGLPDLAVGTARTPVVVFLNQMVVPVELTSFTGALAGNKIMLNWVTATETNNRGFEIQRINNKAEWEVLSFIQGAGNSVSTKYYSFIDETYNKNSRTIRYRLKQIDFDGKFSFSEEISVVNTANVSFHLYQNYPNPFNPTTTIFYILPEPGPVELTIYDALGNKLETLVDKEQEAGMHEISFNAKNLSSGLYFYRLTSGNRTLTGKMNLIK